MKNILLLFLTIFSLNIVLATDTTRVKITYSEVFRVKLLEDTTYKEKLDFLVEFLNKEDVDIEFRGSENDKKYVINLLSMGLNIHNEYLILGAKEVEKTTTFKIIHKLNNDLYKLENPYYMTVFNVIIKTCDRGFVVDLSPNYNSMYSYKSKYFNHYSYEPIKKYEKKKIKKINEFYYDMCCQFELKPQKKKQNYIYGNDLNYLEFLNIEYSVQASGVCLEDFIIYNKNLLDNKHEVIHYILNEYTFPPFINEGIATFYGGSSTRGYEDNFKKTQDLMMEDSIKMNKYIDLYINNKRIGGDYNLFYYAISSKLIEVYKNQNNLSDQGLIDSLNNISINVSDFITKKLNQENSKGFIYKLIIKDYKK